MSFIPIALIVLHITAIVPEDPAPDVNDPIEVVRRQLKDTNRPVEQRATIALDAAARLDKRAEGAESPAERTKLTVTAITLLDEFNQANPRHSLEVAIAIQAAVYLWADARRAIDDAKLTPRPGDEPIKARARKELDASIARFTRIEPALSGVDPLLAQNAHYRLAQARVDRAGLEPDDSPEAKSGLIAAWEALEPLATEPAIVGFAHLLRADIRVKQGNFDGAEKELDAASKVKMPPPIEAILDVRVAQLAGERRYSQAIEAVDSAKLDPIPSAILGIKARVAQRVALSAGAERREADDDAYRRAQVLRTSPRVDARLTLIELARAIDNPSPHADAEAFDTLADGAIGLGDPVRASALLEKGADNAASAQNPNEATRLRLRAGAVLFQAGKYTDADAIFTRMWDKPQTGRDRAKAGMFRVLARGRALAEKVPNATAAAYYEAMQSLVTEYPDDPSTGEARWLLGQAEWESGRFDRAVSHWNSIVPGQPRWQAARLAIAQNNERLLDELRIIDDPRKIKATYQVAVEFLNQSVTVVAGTNAAIELELALARLDLRPEVSRAEAALAICNRLEQSAASEAQRGTIQTLKLVALAELSQFLEAEREARAWAAKMSLSDLRHATKLLDHASVATENDTNRARYGRLILRLLAEQSPKRKETYPPALAAELNLRFVRAQIATGSTDTARRAIGESIAPTATLLDADDLRDLADAYLRVEAYSQAIDVERLRVRTLKPGTPAWLESRYGLALSLFRSRKSAEARRLIDATEILHPDLGGAGLKDRFTRLRQRIEPE